MAQIVVEKKQPRILKWMKKNKDKLVGIAYLTVGFAGAYAAGCITDSIVTSLHLQTQRADGFIKLFDPSTGEEVSYKEYVKLVDRFYKK